MLFTLPNLQNQQRLHLSMTIGNSITFCDEIHEHSEYPRGYPFGSVAIANKFINRF